MKTELTFGVGLGISYCVWTLITFVAGLDSTNIDIGHYGDYIVLILPVMGLFLAIHRKKNMGQTRFRYKDALRTGIVVSFIAYLIYQPFLTVYHHFINPQWLDYVIDFQKQRMIGAGMSQTEIDQRIAQIISGSNDFVLAGSGLVFGVVVLGSIISTVAFLVVRESKQHSS